MPPKQPAIVLSEADIALFFAAQHFIAARQPARSAAKPQGTTAATTGSGSGSTAVASSALPPSGGPPDARGGGSGEKGAATSTTPASSVAQTPTLKGMSTTAANRVLVPAALVQPLEQLRMDATNAPIDEENLNTSRAALKQAMLAQYPAAEDQEAIEALFVPPPPQPEGSSPKKPLAKEKPGTMKSALARAFGVSDMQSMQEILPGLWCGSFHPATDAGLLQRHHITHILCCIGTAARFASTFMYLTIPADDSPDYDISPFFSRTFEFIENALVKEGGGVLVHCGAGISRAPTITAAYLIRKLSIPATEAIAFVQSKRPYASPNMGFRKQLRAYASSLGIEERTDKRASAAAEEEGRAAALQAILQSESKEAT